MIRQASVTQIREQKISRKSTHIVVAMCFYPRGVKKEWSDEFRNILAPDRTLFKEWKDYERQHGHDQAFVLSRYEERFELSPVALTYLKMYSEWAREKDIYFICQCDVGERCHREMLMLVAHKKYGAEIGEVFHTYPTFEKRIADLKDEVWAKS